MADMLIVSVRDLWWEYFVGRFAWVGTDEE
jgi:hypothetical protein